MSMPLPHPDPNGMTGAVAIVTGGGTGIGAATARLLAHEGLEVVIVGRRPELLAEVAASSSAITAIPADLGEADAPRRIVAEVTDRLGRLDVLVNCAAVIRNHPVAEYTLAEIDQHLDVNIRAPFLLTQAALPALTAAPNASIVNISSSSATIVRPGQSLYGTTKAALEYFTRSMAGELAPVGIRVNGIAPGPIDTPIHETWADDLDEAYRWLAAQVPLGRIGVADEIANWIWLLAGPVASFVTGVVIPVDGGQTLDIV
jgi:NAD(P)-dependent dehydrogenase (short-subunit alcohol dehydrogenase family)